MHSNYVDNGPGTSATLGTRDAVEAAGRSFAEILAEMGVDPLDRQQWLTAFVEKLGPRLVAGDRGGGGESLLAGICPPPGGEDELQESFYRPRACDFLD